MAYKNFGVVQEDATLRFFLTSHTASGARVGPTSAMTATDFLFVKNGSFVSAPTSGITVNTNWQTSTATSSAKVGVHRVAVDLSAATTFERGSDWDVIAYPDNQIDGKNVTAVAASWSIESAGDQARRLLRDSVHNTTIRNRTSQGVFEIVAGATEADLYNEWSAIIKDQSNAHQIQITSVLDYAGGTGKQLTVATRTLRFAHANADDVVLVPINIVGAFATSANNVRATLPTTHTVQLVTGTGGGQVQLSGGKVSLATGQTVLVASGGGAGKLTFSSATAGGRTVRISVARINDTLVTGAGATGNKWRAAT